MKTNLRVSPRDFSMILLGTKSRIGPSAGGFAHGLLCPHCTHEILMKIVADNDYGLVITLMDPDALGLAPKKPAEVESRSKNGR